MKTYESSGGGWITEPETAFEKAIHEAAVAACVKAIRDEIDNIEEHRQIGSDPGDFRDVGLVEAADQALVLGATLDNVGDYQNAVACDKRVIAALDKLYDELR